MNTRKYIYSEVVNEGYPQYGKEKVLQEGERMPLIDECLRLRERYRVVKTVMAFMDQEAPEYIAYRTEIESLQNRFRKIMAKMPKEDRDLLDSSWLH